MARDVAKEIIELSEDLLKKQYEEDESLLEIEYNPATNPNANKSVLIIKRLNKNEYQIDDKFIIQCMNEEKVKILWEFILRHYIRTFLLEAQSVTSIVLRWKKKKNILSYGHYGPLFLYELENERDNYINMMHKLVRFVSLTCTSSIRIK
jgi:glycerophosphoryl diester phosphodiesterase